MSVLRNLFTRLSLVLLTALPLLAESAEKVAGHANEARPTLWSILTRPAFITKYVAMILIGLLVLFLLKRGKMGRGLKVALLFLSFVLFGLVGNIAIAPFSWFAMHPSPMCVTKALLYGFRVPFGVMLATILLLTLIGPRLFCGWVCPVGALQELVEMVRAKLGWRRGRFSFTLAHAVRLLLFVAFIFLSATAVIHVVVRGNMFAASLYDYLNAFHGLEFSIPETLLAGLLQYLPLVLVVLLSFRYYRPFCHFVCPIGLFTHWAEQVSLLRIRFHKSKCTNCNVCVQAAPCTAMPDILQSATLRPDCFSCNECVRVCPEKALDVGIKRTVS